MIMDDLEVKPLSTVSIISLLSEVNVKDVGVVQEKEINLSMDEGLKMLKASFMTQTVLTHVFLGGEKSQKTTGRIPSVYDAPI
ncbi:hypothetical protein HS088_TW09G00701 [Tripterygium wilfordii]|uniref:Uncharacterized protein n=2 Tax=Tripterygium wilfordii TaxID=458696 RepID=A0A7J7D8G0_TRIWF|nr:hypothetical protein HS088_TW09G00701 [Tripterygium wilfordii]